ncbi:calcium-binding protein [Haematospirillum sp. H1815]|uniref:calcium-binding protein n=1 Tax=Haematospirillum sp. H1815 TaxID=2723108 RepID=UPI0014388DA2|nr:calcium-binding protein [Haematospirillum sp. H1815]NKD76287.1 calcium-binding protein [Haematospirillum sp. H1815]
MKPYDMDPKQSIIGTDQNDLFIGNNESNIFRGMGGRDIIDGSGCQDTADYSDKVDPVVVTLKRSLPVNVFVGGVTEDVLINIENVIGGSGDDRLVGDDSMNVFRGGPGQDYIDGGDSLDFADYSDKNLPVHVALRGKDEVRVYVGGKPEDTIRNIEQIVGGSGDDRLIGDDEGNTFRGGDGRDYIDGGAGMDAVDFLDKTTSVHLTLAEDGAESVAFVEGIPEDTIKNIEVIMGGSGDDCLIGNSTPNWIAGGDGNDTLQGNGGNDLLIGDKGADTFVYVSFEDSLVDTPDYIIDFNSAEGDRVDLSAIDGDRLTDGFQSLHFGGTLPRPNGVWYEECGNINEFGGLIAGRNITIHVDVDGDALADMMINLCEGAPEGAPNFVLSDPLYLLS